MTTIIASKFNIKKKVINKGVRRSIKDILLIKLFYMNLVLLVIRNFKTLLHNFYKDQEGASFRYRNNSATKKPNYYKSEA